MLRPKPMLTNLDHGVYWENYLEAINLDSGGVLVYLVNLNGSVAEAGFMLRWTEERQLA